MENHQEPLPFRTRNDHRWIDHPELGRVPSAPRSHRHNSTSSDRGHATRKRTLARDERRNLYWEPYPRDRRDQSRRQGEGDLPLRHHRISIDEGASELFVPDNRSFLQRLNDGYIERQQQLRDQALREAGARAEQDDQRPTQNPERVRRGENENTSSEDEVQIKQESADDQSVCLPDTEISGRDIRTHSPLRPQRFDKETSKRPPDEQSVANGIRETCYCPVGFECQAKADGNIDCRTLVTEHSWDWTDRETQPKQGPGPE